MTIQEYFTDKVLLLTGSTGLVGRVLLEKILYDLPNVRRVYVIIRPKVTRSGEVISATERFRQDILGSSAFERLRRREGDGFESLIERKVVAIEGDLSQECLGVNADVLKRLQNEVKVIINCAAVVSFDASLDVALNLNTLGPLRVLEFAAGCVDPMVAHVSTCYVSGIREGLVDEEPLDPSNALSGKNVISDPYDVDREVAELTRVVRRVEARSRSPWRKMVLSLATHFQVNGRGSAGTNEVQPLERLRREWVEQRLVTEGMRRAKYRGWNDTYTFTKAMGEQMIMRHRGDLPMVIFRPAIIESAFETPEPGWLDGLRMVDPLIVAYGRRQITEFPVARSSISDIVPVDMTVNALLAAIPKAHQEGGCEIYQLATGDENPLTYEGLCDLLYDYFQRESLGRRRGATKEIPYNTFPTVGNFLRRIRYRYIIPLRILEILGLLVSITPWGRRLRTFAYSRRSAAGRVYHWGQIYSPYGNTSCIYRASRTGELFESLSAEERHLFNFDVRRIVWKNYIQDVHIPGIKRFLLGVKPQKEEEQAKGGADTTEDLVGQSGSRIPRDSGDGQKGSRRATMGIAIPEKERVKRWLGTTWLWGPTRAFTRLSVSLVLRYYVGLRAEGLSRLPTSGPVIIVANHTSHLDTGVLLTLLGKRYRNLHPVAATDYWFRNRRWSWLSRAFIDAIPFDRHSHTVESLGLAIALLRQNHALIFYPEGGRSPSGNVQPFKPGIGLLALESGATVIPVGISGSDGALAKGKSVPKRHPIHVRFGEPISMEKYRSERTDNDTHELVRRITDEVQQAVMALR